MKRIIGIVVAATLVATTPPRSAAASDDAGPRFVVELESGAVFQTRNDVQIPNDSTGTRFSIRDLVGTYGGAPTWRVHVTWNVASRHAVRAVLAPLTIEDDGVLEERTDFAGTRFDAGERVTAKYRFNSWRATYRWRFRESSRNRFWLGFTAKIRDAEVALRSRDVAGRDARDTNVGFVPLLHLGWVRRLGDRTLLDVELDALAGGPGRAEDLAVKLRRELGGGWTLGAGYRMIEGGADVSDVYSFAWLHQAAVSITWQP